MPSDPATSSNGVPDADHGRPPGLEAALADQPSRIAGRLDRLNTSVRDEESLLDLMFQIALEATRSMPDVDWAGVTAQFDGSPFTMAHTQERVLIVDERQYSTGDGPCLRAMREGTRILMSTEQLSAQWPELGQTALAAGVHTVLAIPVPAFGILPAASLNLYSSRAGAFDAPDENTASVLACYLGAGLTRYCELQPELGSTMRLKAAFETRRAIDLAIGTLMHHDPRLTADQAQDHLIEQAQQHGLSALDAARHILTRPGMHRFPEPPTF